MAETRKFVKVFLASPGDLGEERVFIKSIVDELNELHSAYTGYQIDLIGWEDTVSALGRPQAVINRELDKCEFFLGLMWKSWGTPTGTYSSGFEEEFERSFARNKETGKPDISLFFKAIEPERLKDIGPSLTNVLAFKDRIRTERILLYEEFNGQEQLAKKIKRCLMGFLHQLMAADNATEPKSAKDQPDTAVGKETVDRPQVGNIQTDESIAFLREFISVAETSQIHLTKLQVARYRLLGSAFHKQGNDRVQLGAHDANLLYKNKKDIRFSNREISALIECGLGRFSTANTPLWTWVEMAKSYNRHALPFFSYLGEADQREGALEAMRLTEERIPPEVLGKTFKRGLVIGSWFEASVDSKVTIAGLRYLAQCGTTEDILIVKTEIEKANSKTFETAVDAVLRIYLRNEKSEALKALMEFQPKEISLELVEELFENSRTVTLDLLLEAVRHRSKQVRYVAARILIERNAVTSDISTAMLEDDDAQTRLMALEHQLSSGLRYTDVEAKAILVKPTGRRGLTGLAGAFGFGANIDKTGEAAWRQFRLNRLKAVSEKDLQNLSLEESDVEANGFFILADRFFGKHSAALRAIVSDLGTNDFASYTQKLTEKFGEASDVVKNLPALEQSVRRTRTRRALDVLVSKLLPEDLILVRRALESDFLGYSERDILYFEKYGEWLDIELILKQSNKNDTGGALAWYESNDKRMRLAAKAILAIGKGRLTELVMKELPSAALKWIVADSNKVEFKKIPDETLYSLLHHGDTGVRKSTCLKIILCLSRAKVASLLSGYLEKEQTFYNVLHWLDMGLALQRSDAQRAAENGLERTVIRNVPS